MGLIAWKQLRVGVENVPVNWLANLWATVQNFLACMLENTTSSCPTSRGVLLDDTDTKGLEDPHMKSSIEIFRIHLMPRLWRPIRRQWFEPDAFALFKGSVDCSSDLSQLPVECPAPVRLSRYRFDRFVPHVCRKNLNRSEVIWFCLCCWYDSCRIWPLLGFGGLNIYVFNDWLLPSSTGWACVLS